MGPWVSIAGVTLSRGFGVLLHEYREFCSPNVQEHLRPKDSAAQGITAVHGEGALLSHGLDGELALGIPAWGKRGWSKEYLLFRA